MAKIAMRLFSRRETPRPVLLGVVGDSGCGKSTFGRGLQEVLGRGRVLEICLDDYHRYDRAERARLGLTALDPAANNLELMTEHLATLRAGQRILKPVYDHATGRFAHPEAVGPRPVIIVHGLLALFTPQLAQLFDLRLFLDPQESLRLDWKIARDTDKRGYQLEEVLQQIAEREHDAATYIAPQKSAADLIISFHRPVVSTKHTPLAVRLTPGPTWVWPRQTLRPMFQAGQPLEISGTLNPVAISRLAWAFHESRPANSLLTEQVPGQHLKKLGYYTHHTGEQRQSQTLALTQFLVAGRLAAPSVPAEFAAAVA